MIQERFEYVYNALVKYFDQVFTNIEYIKKINEQFFNVLENCDKIKYDQIGTADAYVLIHFLDRFHRFQMTFDKLKELNIMPERNHKINILDVGTGPGPSMYAISDFYAFSNTSSKKNLDDLFEIDYVEQSYEFRHWLHHFTEFINFQYQSCLPWKVPYHHGSFFDFENINFNKTHNIQDINDDGDIIYKRLVVKHRFDVIVMSNFLTTEEQVLNLEEKIKDCIRYLRNKGILIIVGAKGTSKKYKNVYAQLDTMIQKENYNTYKFKASCKKLPIINLSYSWADDYYGDKLKELISMYKNQIETNNINLDEKMKLLIENAISKTYDKKIKWEIHVYKKYAKMRKYSEKTFKKK